MVPTLVENFYKVFYCTYLLTFFGNTVMIMIEINTGAVQESSKGSMNTPFCPAVTDP